MEDILAPPTGTKASVPQGSAPAVGTAVGGFGTALSTNVKVEVGRATWTLLHVLAAQLPERPTRKQQQDVRTLVDCLTRIYPCGDCALHFAQLVKRNPPDVITGDAFRLWLCRVHNQVNARLGKAPFNCDMVNSRWAPLECKDKEEPTAAAGGCTLLGAGTAAGAAIVSGGGSK